MRTRIRQDSQVHQSDAYADGLPAGPTLETGSTDLQFDLNAIRSQLRRVIGTSSWTDPPSASVGLNKLIYYIDEGPAEGFVGGYKEITGVPWPVDITWYTDVTKTKKIVSKSMVRNVDQAPTQITWTLYDADGVTPLISATDVITNTGDPPVFELSRVRTIA